MIFEASELYFLHNFGIMCGMIFGYVFHIAFLFVDICFHTIPSTNAESENKGGGGVSPPGVFDKNLGV